MLESKTKLIVCDLDGTLLNSDQKISDHSIATVVALRKKGHIFCIATGRPRRGAINYYNQLGLNSIMVNINGAYISNPADKTHMPLNFTFSKDVAYEIVGNKHILDLTYNAVVETAEAEYVLRKPKLDSAESRLLEMFHIDLSDSGSVRFLENRDSLAMDPNSILLVVKKKENISAIRKVIKEISKTLIVREWSTQVKAYVVVEINSVFATKGMALKYLSSYYNIPLSDTYVFGDGVNDLEMLSKAGAGFAMSNSGDDIKAAAKFESERTNDLNGVAVELEKIFGLRR